MKMERQNAFGSALRPVPTRPPMTSAKTVIHPAAQVDPDACLGQGCRIDAGAVLPAGCVLGDQVQVGANAVFVAPAPGTDERAARVERGACIGALAVVMPGVAIASDAQVRPGAVVMRSVPHGAIVQGNPAEIIGYVDATSGDARQASLVRADFDGSVALLQVDGVTLRRLHVVPDLRGSLTVGEFERDIPFLPHRYFMVFGVPSREIRGEHAHRVCHQFLICVHGTCSVVVDDGRRRAEVRLDMLDVGLHLPPMIWGTQYRYSPDAVLLVFASHHYDPDDYIRSYDEFLTLRRPS